MEDAFSAHPDVVETAVIGRAHPGWGETVLAVVVVKDGTTSTGPQLQAFLRDKLAKYEIPREVPFMPELPHTPTGKVMKYRLREMIARSC